MGLTALRIGDLVGEVVDVEIRQTDSVLMIVPERRTGCMGERDCARSCQ